MLGPDERPGSPAPWPALLSAVGGRLPVVWGGERERLRVETWGAASTGWPPELCGGGAGSPGDAAVLQTLPRLPSLQNVHVPRPCLQAHGSSFRLKDAETNPSRGMSSLGGASWLLGFCTVPFPPLQQLQGDCSRDVLFFLGRLSHHSPIGSPPDLEGGHCQAPRGAEAISHLAWTIILFPCELSAAHGQAFLEAL